MKKLISVLLTIAMLLSNIALAAVTLSDLLEKGGNYAVNGEFEKAISAYENLSKGTADESLTQAYMSALILTGQKEKALSLGLSLPENINSEIAECISL